MYSYLGALLLLCFTTSSSAYLDGAQSESCYDHLITHVTTVRGMNVTSLSELCFPCSYTLEVLGRVMDNGGLNTTGFANTTMTNLTFQYNETYKLLLERGINGFLGFLVQARESDSTMFDRTSSIIGIFDDSKPLYKALRCKKNSTSSEAPVPNSATHRDSDDFRGADKPGQVELYWTPMCKGENKEISFWFTIVQQHLTHFFPVKGPSGTLMCDPTTTEPPTTTESPTTTEPPTTTTSTTPETTSSPNETGLSMLETIGIGVGAGVAVLLLIVVIILVIVIVAVRAMCYKGKKEKSGPGVEYNPNDEKATID